MNRIHDQTFRKTLIDQIQPTFKEVVYIIMLTCFLIFFSFIAHTRVEPNREAGPGFVNVYFGFPMEWFKITANEGSWYSSLTRTYILWIGLAADIFLFTIISLALVRLADKVAEYLPRPKLKP